MPHVLLRMVRSSHFFAAGNWVIPSQGKGIMRRRAEACWRMLTEPERTCMPDVDSVFFRDCRDRYFMTPPAHAFELGEGMQEGESPSVARVFALAAQRRAERAAAAALLSKPAMEQGPTLRYDVTV